MGNSRFKTTCREDSCKADIVMLKTTNGKWCPVDADTVDEDYEGPFDIAAGHVSHFKTCTKADQFSKNRQTQHERVSEQKVNVDPSRPPLATLKRLELLCDAAETLMIEVFDNELVPDHVCAGTVRAVLDSADVKEWREKIRNMSFKR